MSTAAVVGNFIAHYAAPHQHGNEAINEAKREIASQITETAHHQGVGASYDFLIGIATRQDNSIWWKSVVIAFINDNTQDFTMEALQENLLNYFVNEDPSMAKFSVIELKPFLAYLLVKEMITPEKIRSKVEGRYLLEHHLNNILSKRLYWESMFK